MLLLHRASSFLCLSHPKPQLIFSSAPRAPASARSDSVKILLPADRCRYGRLCSVGGDGNAYSPSDAESSCPSEEGIDHGGRHEGGPLASNETLKKLKRYGIAGILSYGLLNTAYYLTTFLLVWFYFAPAPGRMGYLAAVERFIKVMAMVWAGSQVTKLIRAGGALALAPFVDRGLSWFTTKCKFESQEKAFLAIVGFCFGLAILLFLAVTLISA
ncbi:hypothetical protein EUGRSUZ_G03186 [Eucalyptus grandis]|uniref:Uncharacterized protein n=2 Tax=Eucalyptus grandis TaxID=71139 RepID=A0ACC3KAN8_EUCGR|nr:hypothetical protein EUGRSUZ_G03186 [Eucalyptus grandis]